MPTYRKRPVEVEAFKLGTDETPDWFKVEIGQTINYVPLVGYSVRTLESHDADLTANFGDYIIKGVEGEIYPCREDIFELTYELVEKK